MLVVLFIAATGCGAPATPTSKLISREAALEQLRVVPAGSELVGGRVDFLRIDRKEAKLAAWGEWRRLDTDVHARPDLDPNTPVWVVVAEGQILSRSKPGAAEPTVGGVVVDARSGEMLTAWALPRPWPSYWDQLPDRAPA